VSASFLEECHQKGLGLLLQNAAGEGGTVVVGIGGEVDEAAEGAGPAVVGAEDHPVETGVDDGAGTHGAGLQGHVEGTAGEAPAAEALAGFPDAEELGTVIEAIAMKSQELVTPEFYENQLKYRDARDNDSAEMLDLIFATRAFDLGPVFSWGNILNCYTTMDTNYASRFDSTLDAAELAMLDSIELIATYN
jgi:hypothetical protein